MLIWFRFALIESQWIGTYTETHTHTQTHKRKKQKTQRGKQIYAVTCTLYNKMRFMVSFVSLSVQESFTVWKLSISFPTSGTHTRTHSNVLCLFFPLNESVVNDLLLCICECVRVYIIANSQVPDKTVVRFTDQRPRLFISRFQKKCARAENETRIHTTM